MDHEQRKGEVDWIISGWGPNLVSRMFRDNGYKTPTSISLESDGDEYKFHHWY
jgi:hypothetical protein